MRHEVLKLDVQAGDEAYPADIVVHLPEGRVPVAKVGFEPGPPELVGVATLAREPGAVVAESDVPVLEGMTLSVGYESLRSDVDAQGVRHHREIRVVCAVLVPAEAVS